MMCCHVGWCVCVRVCRHTTIRYPDILPPTCPSSVAHCFKLPQITCLKHAPCIIYTRITGSHTCRCGPRNNCLPYFREERVPQLLVRLVTVTALFHPAVRLSVPIIFSRQDSCQSFPPEGLTLAVCKWAVCGVLFFFFFLKKKGLKFGTFHDPEET